MLSTQAATPRVSRHAQGIFLHHALFQRLLLWFSSLQIILNYIILNYSTVFFLNSWSFHKAKNFLTIFWFSDRIPLRNFFWCSSGAHAVSGKTRTFFRLHRYPTIRHRLRASAHGNSSLPLFSIVSYPRNINTRSVLHQPTSPFQAVVKFALVRRGLRKNSAWRLTTVHREPRLLLHGVTLHLIPLISASNLSINFSWFWLHAVTNGTNYPFLNIL